MVSDKYPVSGKTAKLNLKCKINFKKISSGASKNDAIYFLDAMLAMQTFSYDCHARGKLSRGDLV